MKRWIALAALGVAVSVVAAAQDGTPAAPAAQSTAPAPAATATATVNDGGTIRGTVKAGQVPLPGVSVTATNTLTGKKYATTTDINGAFAMSIPRKGRYVVKAELAAFAPATQEVVLNAAGENGGKPEQVTDFGLELASRAAQQQAAQQATAQSAANGLARGMQSLNLSGDGEGTSDASANAGANNSGAQLPTLAGVGSQETASESVAVSGQMGQTNGLANFNEDEIRQRVQDAIENARRQGGATGDMANVVVSMLVGMMNGVVMGGGPGGPGGGPGGPGGGPGGGQFMIMGPGGGGRGMGGGAFRNFNPTQLHGGIFYQGSFSAMNAAPFSVASALGEPGAQVIKP
ncbi:MAG TPA: carboxypeptidase-like regulatory domain-containing protein, partial [Edaphobacter sp.]